MHFIFYFDKMDFSDYCDEDKKLHDFVIKHNRKLRDIKTIVNNIMWALCALCDSFEGFQFITMDENVLSSIVYRYGFTPYYNNIIIDLINKVKLQSTSIHKYDELQRITNEYNNVTPNDLLNIARTSFVELASQK